MRATHARFLALALVSLVLATAAVIGSALYVYAAFGRVAAEISEDAIPSMLVLADARSELRLVHESMEEILDEGGELPHAEVQLERARHALADDLERYRALPSFPEEVALWPELERHHAEVEAVMDRVLEMARHAPGQRSSPALVRDLRQATNQLDAALVRTIKLDGSAATRLGEQLASARRTALPAAATLSVLSIAVAAGAVVVAGRLVGRALAGEHAAAEREREARVELERRARELEAFSGSVAHDLLSPLMTVGLALNLAGRRLAPDEKEKTGHVLAAAERSLQGVRQLVDGLLQFARANARPRPGDRVDACDVVRGVVDDHLLAARQSGVEIRVEKLCPAVVACSPGVLISIVGNLLQNAMKALADSRVRRISLRVSPEPPMARFEVEDTGPGIDPARHAAIFEPHVRGPHGGPTGFGLGLATVKRLVESCGGEVGLESEPGQGALFWFTLPLAAKGAA